MASATKSREELVLQQHYADLINTLARNIDDVLRGLVSKGVINITEKQDIRKYKDMPGDRVEYLLDHYVERSLAAGITDNFMKLLDVMKEIAYCKPLAVSIERKIERHPSQDDSHQHGGEMTSSSINEQETNEQEIKGSPNNVAVPDYTRVGKPIKIVNNNGNMVKPCGIAFGKNGMWAVADNTKHCVYIFDEQDQLIRKIGNHGSGNGELLRPEGVTFDSNNYLYVADHGNNRIQKFNVDGNYVQQIGNSGSGNGQLNGPVGIATHNNNKVFVTEYINQRISVFHTNGQFSRIIGKRQLGRPYDVTVNTNNQLLVADYDHHCIYVYKMNGDRVSKVATIISSRGHLSSPYSLATDLYDFILVSDAGNHRVSIFNNDGNFIHCFGSRGSDDGKFKRPHGIAISPNGNIHVCDSDNKRVQIFSPY